MTAPQQTRLFITLAEQDAETMFDALDTALEDDGYAVSMFETEEDSGVFEVSVYVDVSDVDTVSNTIDAIAQDANVDAVVETEALPNIDWVSKSLEGLQPVRVGRFVVHGSHDRDAVAPTDISIEIEAGQAFGTGHHGTTAGCIEMMARLFKSRLPNLALDVGTGSAVLAIAAAKGWKIPVVATDIDPVATKVAKENAKLNGVSSLVHCETAIGFAHETVRTNGPFDMIIANILARPLMKMAPAFAENLAWGGDVVLSGILAEQRNKVLSAFRLHGLYHRQTIWREGWVTLHLRAGGQD
ncbi:MAG: 50S ribosomal protein L11 methyltransferase [Pseudomonadota bacterium]